MVQKNAQLIGLAFTSFLENSALRSESPKLGPRVQDTSPAVWCGFGSKTYISVDYDSDIHDQSWNMVDDFLDSIGAVIRNEIRTAGDSLIPGGLITYQNAGLLLRSQNANNHQQTWGVLGSGVSALSDYMIDQKNQGYTPSFVTFLLYDGPNQVANATFSPRTLYG